MTQLLAVFLGGGLGAAMRWQCQHFLNVPDRLPWGTFAVNLIGGFVAGCCLALSDRLSADVRLFIVTGILGGLTTFSALSYEIVGMLFRGEVITGFIYGILSLILATLCCWVGFYMTSRLAL